MEMALALAEGSAQAGGGPFGAVIVGNGRVVGKGKNEVTLSNDPTAHAEVVAIRNAARELRTFDLSGCTIYASCEPCPMCLGAIYWARIGEVYYSAGREDAKQAGFDDDRIYREISLHPDAREIPMKRVLQERSGYAFRLWMNNEQRTSY